VQSFEHASALLCTYTSCLVQFYCRQCPLRQNCSENKTRFIKQRSTPPFNGFDFPWKAIFFLPCVLISLFFLALLPSFPSVFSFSSFLNFFNSASIVYAFPSFFSALQTSCCRVPLMLNSIKISSLKPSLF
jgi:hypothetical protein